MDDIRAHGRVLLARHGQTRWNVEGRRLGREDIPLDEVGRVQALHLRDALADQRIGADPVAVGVK